MRLIMQGAYFFIEDAFTQFITAAFEVSPNLQWGSGFGAFDVLDDCINSFSLNC